MTSTIIRNISRLATIPGPGPRRGTQLSDTGIIPNAALLIRAGQIAWVGPDTDRPPTPDATEIDACGRAIIPGFIDSHTHAIFAGDRVTEFERRLQGISYQKILAEGGGILATVTATRTATLDDLVAQTSPRLETILAHGTTTVEIKTGYGLDSPSELKMLAAIHQLMHRFAGRLTIVPTFMPAHAIPQEHRTTPDDFVTQIVEDILPAGMAAHRAAVGDAPIFADVFCEDGAFTLDQTRRILTRAHALGYRLKVHADEFEALGATTLAADLGAISADHLMATTPTERARLAASPVVATFLPGTTFGLANPTYVQAREWIAAGAAVALATDLNPGTCYCPSMPFMMALATRYLV